jgi:hypothetical protein
LHGELALLQAGGSVRQRRAARKRGRLLAKVAAGLALVLSALAAFNYLRPRPSESVPVEPPQPVTRIAIPEAAVLARSEQEIEAECRTKLAGAGTEATARLAEELVRQSATSADTAREFAMLRVAARLANEAEVYEVTLLACDKMGLRFQAEILPVKMELLSKGTLPPRTAKGAASLAEACVATGFEAIALDEYNQAQALSALAQNAATNVTAPYLIGEALFLEHEADHCSKAYRDVKMFAETLRKNPADPGASLAVGEFLGFVKNDWEKGLPMMAHGNDERLKAVLEVELNHKPVHPRDQLAAGDLWWALAGGEAGPRKRDFQRRARYWYLKGIARSRGAEKETLKQQLAARIKAVPSPAAEVHIKSRVDATEHILLTADDIRWASSRGSLNDRISQIYVGELKPGVVRTFKNCGATRLFPEDVDFSTAQLTIDHKAKRRGRATLETGEDHVRIILADPPMGSSELEVTVSFLATSSSAASPSPAGP